MELTWARNHLDCLRRIDHVIALICKCELPLGAYSVLIICNWAAVKDVNQVALCHQVIVAVIHLRCQLSRQSCFDNESTQIKQLIVEKSVNQFIPVVHTDLDLILSN